MAHWRQHVNRTRTKHEKEKCWLFWKGAALGIGTGVAVTLMSLGVAWVYIVVTQPAVTPSYLKGE